MGKMVKVAEIKTMIIELRGQKVMLDRDLAMLYGVTPKRLMEQVKRNQDRFPADFMFHITKKEMAILRSQIATSSWGGRRYFPYVFTRNGANMLSAILRTSRAVNRSIQIMRAFTALEEVLGKNEKPALESPKIVEKLSTHSRAIMHLFQRDKLKQNEINRIKEISLEMINILQQIVIRAKFDAQ